MNQEIKIIALSKNSFQNMVALQNCSLKKCIAELSPQKSEHKQEEIFTDKNGSR